MEIAVLHASNLNSLMDKNLAAICCPVCELDFAENNFVSAIKYDTHAPVWNEFRVLSLSDVGCSATLDLRIFDAGSLDCKNHPNIIGRHTLSEHEIRHILQQHQGWEEIRTYPLSRATNGSPAIDNESNHPTPPSITLRFRILAGQPLPSPQGDSGVGRPPPTPRAAASAAAMRDAARGLMRQAALLEAAAGHPAAGSPASVSASTAAASAAAAAAAAAGAAVAAAGLMVTKAAEISAGIESKFPEHAGDSEISESAGIESKLSEHAGEDRAEAAASLRESGCQEAAAGGRPEPGTAVSAASRDDRRGARGPAAGRSPATDSAADFVLESPCSSSPASDTATASAQHHAAGCAPGHHECAGRRAPLTPTSTATLSVPQTAEPWAEAPRPSAADSESEPVVPDPRLPTVCLGPPRGGRSGLGLGSVLPPDPSRPRPDELEGPVGGPPEGAATAAGPCQGDSEGTAGGHIGGVAGSSAREAGPRQDSGGGGCGAAGDTSGIASRSIAGGSIGAAAVDGAVGCHARRAAGPAEARASISKGGVAAGSCCEGGGCGQVSESRVPASASPRENGRGGVADSRQGPGGEEAAGRRGGRVGRRRRQEIVAKPRGGGEREEPSRAARGERGSEAAVPTVTVADRAGVHCEAAAGRADSDGFVTRPCQGGPSVTGGAGGLHLDAVRVTGMPNSDGIADPDAAAVSAAASLPWAGVTAAAVSMPAAGAALAPEEGTGGGARVSSGRRSPDGSRAGPAAAEEAGPAADSESHGLSEGRAPSPRLSHTLSPAALEPGAGSASESRPPAGAALPPEEYTQAHRHQGGCVRPGPGDGCPAGAAGAAAALLSEAAALRAEVLWLRADRDELVRGLEALHARLGLSC